MSITTTIKVGESGKTITLNEGRSMTLKGSAGAAGVAYLLDQDLGGTNSKQSWIIGTGALAPIGPFDGSQKILIVCTAGSIGAVVGDAVLGVPRGQSGFYKRPGRKAFRQVASRQIVVNNGTVAGYTYHNNFVLESKKVIAIRPPLNCINVAALTGVKFSLAPTANFNDPIHPTGAWIDATASTMASSTLTVSARLGAEQPSLTRFDWIPVTPIEPSDGGNLSRFCARVFVPAANTLTSEGAYDLSVFWHNASTANAGRVFQTFRQDVDGITNKAAFTSTTPYGNPGLFMGWEYLLSTGEIFTMGSGGDSVIEGAVNSPGDGTNGNFGNSWVWQSIKLFRERHPDVLIEYANLGLSGRTPDVYQPFLLERLGRTELDGFIYSPFSGNSGVPDASVVSTMAALNGTLQDRCRLYNIPVLYQSPCCNTAQNWTAASDKYRQYAKIFAAGEHKMSRSLVDMDILFDGVSAFKPTMTIDRTHPSEAGGAAVAEDTGYLAIRQMVLGY